MKNPDPLVTVAVSTYAAERLLGPCLEMLMNQTLGDRLEVIVVDSGSPEDECSVVQPFLRSGRVHYLRTERETLYAAWNRALAQARGKYFANVNTDDWLQPHALATMAAALDAHPDCALAYADWSLTAAPNSAPGPEDPVCAHTPWVPALHLFYCYSGCVQFWRRSSLEMIGGHDATLSYCGDLMALRHLARAGMRAVYIPEVLLGFFSNPEGLSRQSDAQGSIAEAREITRQSREEFQIEELYAVDPADPLSVADAWTALGVLAIRVRVPWAFAPIPDVGFALECFDRALAVDSDHHDALHNRYATLISSGQPIEAEASLAHLPVDRAVAVRGGDLELRHAAVAPARSGEIFSISNHADQH